jgi:hypothetical protein
VAAVILVSGALSTHDIVGFQAGGAGGDGRPPLLTPPPLEPTTPVPLAPSALRLVVTLTCYDGSASTREAPALASLIPEPEVRLHPLDFANLAVEPGAVVELVSGAGRVSLPAVADPGVVRGTAGVVANLPEAPLNQLLSAASPITDIRLEVPR